MCFGRAEQKIKQIESLDGFNNKIAQGQKAWKTATGKTAAAEATKNADDKAANDATSPAPASSSADPEAAENPATTAQLDVLPRRLPNLHRMARPSSICI